ncbi:unnamed protein product [Symbiodinium sp. CCMP2592]|nr:unnamed protein product [Symbiodinium sp. CCMP2592]
MALASDRGEALDAPKPTLLERRSNNDKKEIRKVDPSPSSSAAGADAEELHLRDALAWDGDPEVCRDMTPHARHISLVDERLRDGPPFDDRPAEVPLGTENACTCTNDANTWGLQVTLLRHQRVFHQISPRPGPRRA